jgi:hypothetical protein
LLIAREKDKCSTLVCLSQVKIGKGTLESEAQKQNYKARTQLNQQEIGKYTVPAYNKSVLISTDNKASLWRDQKLANNGWTNI